MLGDIEYSSHVQNIGWMSYVKNGNLSGTENKGYRIEAIKIRLTGDVARKYNVYYRTYVDEYGWLGWAKNDEESGTEGLGYKIRAIEIKLVEKNISFTGDTSNTFILYSGLEEGEKIVENISESENILDSAKIDLFSNDIIDSNNQEELIIENQEEISQETDNIEEMTEENEEIEKIEELEELEETDEELENDELEVFDNTIENVINLEELEKIVEIIEK